MFVFATNIAETLQSLHTLLHRTRLVLKRGKKDIVNFNQLVNHVQPNATLSTTILLLYRLNKSFGADVIGLY